MKISIWRQFSSNHSAHFTVVGKFSTPDEATKAANELNRIATRIKETTPIPYIIPGRGQGFAPTSTEIQIGKRLGFVWEHGVDWAYWRSTWTSEQPVSIYQNIVWFASPHPFTWQDPQPLDQLMWKLGAKEVAVSADLCTGIPTYPDTCVLCSITFTAPDEDRAQKLFDLFEIEFAIKREKSNDAKIVGIYDGTLTGLPFEWGVFEWHFDNPKVPLFGVEHNGKQLRLIGICLLPDLGEAQALQEIVEYLQREGCSDIEYFFTSERMAPRKDDRAEP